MSGQFDVVGDIHGHASAVESLLRTMGYRPKGKGYTHPERTLVMVGDLIDRGPEQARVLEIIRAMVDSGDALAVMGNHEFNAICYATPNEGAGYVRPHIEKNAHQHRAFLKAFPFGSHRHQEAIAFFKELPLWLELEAFQVVHACWHWPSMETLLPWLDEKNCIRDERFYQHYAAKDEPLYSAVECVLKGPEVKLPAGAEFTDKDGIVRREARINWWQLHKGESASLAVRPDLHDEHDLSVQYQQARYFEYQGEKPTFFGHYWQREFDPEHVRNQRAFCLDYSIAKQGQLIGARWHGHRDNIEWFSVSGK